MPGGLEIAERITGEPSGSAKGGNVYQNEELNLIGISGITVPGEVKSGGEFVTLTLKVKVEIPLHISVAVIFIVCTPVIFRFIGCTVN